jgi:phosphoribosyl 1,2-cyclic phosphodiesterase
MSVQIASINSGSNGNCYYIGNSTEAVLIDAGISVRETEKRMKRMGLTIDRVKAIFVSHEHGDHISGVPGLSKKYHLPVYITTPTLANGNIPIANELHYVFRPHEPVQIGALSVTAFPKYHDAADPHSFMISQDKLHIGVFTDIGVVCRQLEKYFKQCHAAFLEANYDTDMLEKGNYPYHLKKRISGGQGHLSNEQALQLFRSHKPPYMSHLLLAHLSKNNNHPQLVEDLFMRHASGTEIVVASRYKETTVYEITGNSFVPVPAIKKKTVTTTAQLSLF